MPGNIMILHNGGDVYGFDVPHTGSLIFDGRLQGAKMITITNPSSSKGFFLALKDSPDGTTCQAQVGKGIWLPPNGGYEINAINLCCCEIWAIHDEVGKTYRICVQVGS